MAKSDLPQEILIEIFSRLPAKSVGKCRCLDKTWRSLLSTPQFIKSHLLRKPYQQNLILLAPSGSVHSAAATDDAVSRKLQLPHNFFEVSGSCDGLVLLVGGDELKFLVNPITLQWMQITDSPLALPKDDRCGTYGFGCDRISDDYKIVELSFRDPDSNDIFVDVYSARNCVWKRVDNSPYLHGHPDFSCGVFVNSAIHWLATTIEEGPPLVIAVFDLAREVFDEMPLPSDADTEEYKYVDYKLVVLGGCLCLVNAPKRRCEFWIMKEYGVGESWTKFSIEAEFEFDIVKPLYFGGDDEEVILLTEDNIWGIEDRRLVVYNVKEKAMRDMLVDGVPAKFVDGGVFVESLISPPLLQESFSANAELI